MIKKNVCLPPEKCERTESNMQTVSRCHLILLIWIECSKKQTVKTPSLPSTPEGTDVAPCFHVLLAALLLPHVLMTAGKPVEFVFIGSDQKLNVPRSSQTPLGVESCKSWAFKQ